METRALERTRDDADVSPILASLRCGESSILNAIHEELPEVLTAEILPKLTLRATLNLAQVSKWYRDAVWSVDGMRSLGEKVKPMLFKSRPRGTPITSTPLVVTHGNLPAVRAQLDYFRRCRSEPRCMKMRIKDGLPAKETAIVSEEDKAEADALIERMENEIVTNLNSIL